MPAGRSGRGTAASDAWTGSPTATRPPHHARDRPRAPAVAAPRRTSHHAAEDRTSGRRALVAVSGSTPVLPPPPSTPPNSRSAERPGPTPVVGVDGLRVAVTAARDERTSSATSRVVSTWRTSAPRRIPWIGGNPAPPE